MEPEESRTTIRSRVEVQGTTGSGGGRVVVVGVVVVGVVVVGVVVVGRGVVDVGGDDDPVTGGAVIDVVLTFNYLQGSEKSQYTFKIKRHNLQRLKNFVKFLA